MDASIVKDKRCCSSSFFNYFIFKTKMINDKRNANNNKITYVYMHIIDDLNNIIAIIIDWVTAKMDLIEENDNYIDANTSMEARSEADLAPSSSSMSASSDGKTDRFPGMNTDRDIIKKILLFRTILNDNILIKVKRPDATLIANRKIDGHKDSNINEKNEQEVDENHLNMIKDDVNLVVCEAYELLHSRPWKSIPQLWRVIYALASLTLCQINLLEAKLMQAIKQIDLSIILASANPTMDKAYNLGTIATKIHYYIKPEQSAENISMTKRLKEDKVINMLFNQSDFFTSPLQAIQQIECPSLIDFKNNYLLLNRPVLITGYVNTIWPAFTKWNLQYFRQRFGARTVPVESGKHYLDDTFGQKLITIDQLIDHIETRQDDGSNTLYLAQHCLFDQIPELLNDICIPDYCSLRKHSNAFVEDDDVEICSWFGPGNTVSPLHFDPKENLLCQVVGLKRILLFSPTETEKLYPHDKNNQLHFNTSMIPNEAMDLQAWDENYPLFRTAKGIEVNLVPGTVLCKFA